MAGEHFLAYLNPAFALSCAVLLWLLERRWPSHRYLFLLSLAFLYLALGFISQDFFGFAETGAINYAGNGLFLGAVILAACGSVVRSRLPVPVATYTLITAVALIAFLWFALIQPSRAARIYLLSFTYAAILVQTLAVLLRAPDRTLPDRLVEIAIGTAAVVALIRPVLILTGLLDVGDGASFNTSGYWATIRVFTPLLALGVVSTFLSAMALDIHGELKREAEQDFLSRLLNRRGFDVAVTGALERRPQQASGLLLADIDDFKIINDNFGHKTGDDVIASVAQTLSLHGQASLVGRVGGEEFALFYQGDDQSALRRHAEAIRSAIARSHIPGLPEDHGLTLSIGIHMRREGESLDQMLIEADRALYRAKAGGKDRAVVSPIRLRTVGPQAGPA